MCSWRGRMARPLLDVMTSFEFPPLSTPSIAGFAEAPVMAPEVAADLARRIVIDNAAGPPGGVLDDVNPLALGALEAANSLHFRFRLSSFEGRGLASVLTGGDPFSIAGLDDAHPTRKVTVVLPLRAAAEIGFPSVAKVRSLAAGTIAMFPSFLYNEVIPAPEFLALAGHFIGPSFA